MVSEARSMIAMIIAVLMFCAGPGASAQDRATGESSAVQKQIVTVRMSDGVEIALALYLPRGSGVVPALLAASSTVDPSDTSDPLLSIFSLTIYIQNFNCLFRTNDSAIITFSAY